MNTLWHKCKSLLHSIVKRKQLNSEIEEEVSFHLTARAADLEREGLDPREAMRQARLEFGGEATHKDSMRHALGIGWWDELLGDIRYASRILRKSPGFTLIAVSSLALAIGANTTIFSVANEMLYERLSVPHPEQLRLLLIGSSDNSVGRSTWGSNWRNDDGQDRSDSFPYPVYQQLRAANQQPGKQVLEDIVAYKDLGRANATIDGSAQTVQVQLVSGNFYQQLQVNPVLGRGILPSDDGAPGTGAVAVISDGLWSRRFGRSPSVIGKTITVNMNPVTIIGVNPRGFTGAQSVQQSPDLFIPVSMVPLLNGTLGDSGPVLSSKMYWIQLIARAKPGITDARAQSLLELTLDASLRATTTVGKGETLPYLVIEDGSKGLNWSAREFAQPIHVLLGMVIGVLLMACANMANLMLARASARQREMSVRLALGAGRWRILRQVLTESLFLSFLGGALGLLLSYFGRTVLPNLMTSAWNDSPVNVPFDWRVFAFTALITIGTGILFGIYPAWIATRAEIGAALKQGAQTSSRRRKAWSGKGIVAFQVALSTLLVVAAGLFLRTLIKLNSIDPGFRTDHLLLFDINAPESRYPAPKNVVLLGQLEEALRSVPGVESVAPTAIAFLAGSAWNGNFYVEGAPARKYARGDTKQYAYISAVGDDFISTMKIPLIAGRNFNAQDTETSPKVALVNQTLVRRFFDGQNPVGKRFSQQGPDEKERTWYQVIGVFGDTRYDSMRQEPPAVFLDLYRQQADMGGLTFIISTRMDPKAIVPSLRTAVERIDRDLPLMDIRTQEELIDNSLHQERMFASLSSGFGLLALVLACVGIYGIMAYTVVQRTNEIGIRLALGARREQVRGMMLKEAGWLAILGVASGVAVALWLGHLVRTMLYGMQPTDPLSLIGAGCLLLTVALLAGWVPAMRASRVEPMVALRHE